MRRSFGHLFHHPSFDELDPIAPRESASLDHPVVFLHGELRDRKRGRLARNRHVTSLPDSRLGPRVDPPESHDPDSLNPARSLPDGTDRRNKAWNGCAGV
jgi:hypothetical protein